MKKLAQLLRDEMDTRHMSVRQISLDSGLSNVTITRILADLPTDMETVIKICDWLGVSIADLFAPKDENASLSSRLAVLINRDPDLGARLDEALASVENEEMDPEDLRDIAEYITFKLEHPRNRNRKSVAWKNPEKEAQE